MQRPDPDTLLAQVNAADLHAARGKLRIYFGASAGVGKTYAMLRAACALQADGQAVLVGVVETHGRSETAALLEHLPSLAQKRIAYRDKILSEFDLDAALERKPPLILIDELAHSNAPGSRHPKRWQDVTELLDAGIDVYTTVNVQHLESLNDVVGGITGVRVAETLPDTVFDEADEVVLVDVPADELLTRLKEGKIYLGPQAERAAKNFFRKGNLMALRELALRRTADRVDDDLQAYRIEKSIHKVWKTGTSLLACLGPHDAAEHVVRSAARLAGQLNAEWHAIYIETPHLRRLPPAQRERILKTLKLAQSLGATTAIVADSHIAQAISGYARQHNFAKIILGRAQTRWPWRTTTHKRLARLAPDIDLIEIGRSPHLPADTNSRPAVSVSDSPEQSLPWKRYCLAAGASLATALAATPLTGVLDLANIVMLFLLTVVLVAVRLGRGSAAVASVVGVAAFDFFFVTPRFSFAVSDVQYLLTFAVMLSVGLITGHLTADLRFQARVAARREARSRALYEFARELSGVLQTEQIFDITRRYVERGFPSRATLLLPDTHGRLQATLPLMDAASDEAAAGDMATAAIDMGIAQWAFDHAQAAGISTDTLPANAYFYLPLVAPMQTRGLLAIAPENKRWLLIPEQRQHLDTFAALAAIALERVHYIEVAQGALLRMESERLRNSLLAALSHDLRTPLTSLVGISESLTLSQPPLAPHQQELAQVLHAESLRMSALVTNLLDMARIQSGDVQLNLQWQPLEEVVGSALHASAAALAGHRVDTNLKPDLPLLHYDAVLIERVLCNLLENAAKHTPQNSRIVIAAEPHGDFIAVTVYDDGPGLPAGREEAIFEKFTRGERESAVSGVGLGLAICRALIEAHDGTIAAGISPLGGAAVVFTLPLGTPPAPPAEETPFTEGLPT